MKRLISMLAALALVLALLVPAAVAEENDNWLRILYKEDPETLDVQLTTDSYCVPLNCFDRLVEIESVDGLPELVPGLADTWEVSEDGLTYTFHLHEGVTFQNGDPFTADDVVYTVTRMMDPVELKSNTDVYERVEGAMAYYNGEADSISGITAIDDLTVEFTLVEPCDFFLSLLATPAGAIYNRESTEGVADFGTNPAVCFGTGPFQVTEWELGSKVTMVANPNYFKGAPSIDGITMSIVPDENTMRMEFEQGNADVFDFDFGRTQLQWFLDNGYEDQIVSGRRLGTYYLMFNNAIEPLDNVNVRKALQMAIDRQAILDAVYNGRGTVLNCFLSIGVPGHDDNAEEIPYDPEQAKAILAEEGYADGFDMELAVVADSSDLPVYTIIASYLNQIGVRATVKQIDSASYYDIRRDGLLPSYYNNWSADFNDPDNFLYTFFSNKNNAGRSVNYGNEEIKALLDEARLMANHDERMEAYKKIDNAVCHEDAVVLPMYQTEHMFCLSPRVKNFQVSWNGWSNMSYYTVTLEG